MCFGLLKACVKLKCLLPTPGSTEAQCSVLSVVLKTAEYICGREKKIKEGKGIFELNTVLQNVTA